MRFYSIELFAGVVCLVICATGSTLSGCSREEARATHPIPAKQRDDTSSSRPVAAKGASGATTTVDALDGDVAAYNQILDATSTGMLDAATLARGSTFEFLRRQAWDASPVDAVVYAEAMLMKARTTEEKMGASLLIAKHASLLKDIRRAERALLEMPDDQSSHLSENLMLQKYSKLIGIEGMLYGSRTALVYCTKVLATPLQHEQPVTFRVNALDAAARAACVLGDKARSLDYAQQILDMPDPQGVLVSHKMTAQTFIDNYEQERHQRLVGRAQERKVYEEYRTLYARYGDKAVDRLMKKISTHDPRAARAALLNELRFAYEYVPPKE